MCAGCHNLIDPIGFGFEKFDAIGMRREKHKLLVFPRRQRRRGQTRKAEGSGARHRYARVRRRSREFRVHDPAGVRRDAGANAAVSGVHCKAGVPLHGRPSGHAGRPAMLRQALETFRQSGFRFKELIVYLASSKDMHSSGRDSMSHVITKRNRLSRRTFSRA